MRNHQVVDCCHVGDERAAPAPFGMLPIFIPRLHDLAAVLPIDGRDRPGPARLPAEHRRGPHPLEGRPHIEVRERGGIADDVAEGLKLRLVVAAEVELAHATTRDRNLRVVRGDVGEGAVRLRQVGVRPRTRAWRWSIATRPDEGLLAEHDCGAPLRMRPDKLGLVPAVVQLILQHVADDIGHRISDGFLQGTVDGQPYGRSSAAKVEVEVPGGRAGVRFVWVGRTSPFA
mmetsp:Transcript_65064/g.212055  ORF Transcript_65064/g.212055 Transcript_65064/m.212055 type:complete len:230 (+) Transcript_65064:949-1638(+)